MLSGGVGTPTPSMSIAVLSGPYWQQLATGLLSSFPAESISNGQGPDLSSLDPTKIAEIMAMLLHSETKLSEKLG